METNLKAGNLLHRDRKYDANAAAIFPGDIYEWTDPPFYEVDPLTLKCRTTLQCFRVGEDGKTLTAVKRGSWHPVEPLKNTKLLTYKCRICHGWHESTNRNACTAKRWTP